MPGFAVDLPEISRHAPGGTGLAHQVVEVVRAANGDQLAELAEFHRSARGWRLGQSLASGKWPSRRLSRSQACPGRRRLAVTLWHRNSRIMEARRHQIPWRITGSARLLRLDIGKAGLGEIEPIDERVDEPHRIVLSHIVVERLGQQQSLRAVMTGDVWHAVMLPPHTPRRNPSRENFNGGDRDTEQPCKLKLDERPTEAG